MPHCTITAISIGLFEQRGRQICSVRLTPPLTSGRPMIVGLLKMHIHLHGIESLKQKRGIVKSLVGRLKSRFNFSVAEVEAQDSKQLAVIGCAVVGNDTAFIHQQMDTVINFAQADGRFYLGQVEREIFSHNP